MTKTHSSTRSTSPTPLQALDNLLEKTRRENQLQQQNQELEKLKRRNQAIIEKIQRRNQAALETLQHTSQEGQENGSNEGLATLQAGLAKNLRRNKASLAKLHRRNQPNTVQSEEGDKVTRAKSTTEACVIDSNANGSVGNDIVEVQHSADHRVSENDSNKKRKRDPKQSKRGAKPVKSRRRKNEVPRADSTTKECVVCMDRNVSHALVPCGHVCLCHDCASDTSLSKMGMKCPKCRKDISQAMKLFYE